MKFRHSRHRTKGLLDTNAETREEILARQARANAGVSQITLAQYVNHTDKGSLVQRQYHELLAIVERGLLL